MATTKLNTAVSKNLGTFVEALKNAGVLTDDTYQQALDQSKELMETQRNYGAKRDRIPRATVPDEDRCQARIWGIGSERGSGPRCSAAKVDGCSGLCNRCFKKEQQCATPMTLDADGKKMGLFWGRYCDSEGTKIPLPYMASNESTFGKGGVAVIWVGNATARANAEKEIVENGKEFLGAAPYKHQVPARLGGISKQTSKNPKKTKKEQNTNKPKRVPNAYMRMLQKNREEIKMELQAVNHSGGTVSVADIAKAAGVRWKAMSDEEKRPFVEEYITAKKKAVEDFTAANQSIWYTEEADENSHELPAAAATDIDDSSQVIKNGDDAQIPAAAATDIDDAQIPAAADSENSLENLEEQVDRISPDNIKKFKVNELREWCDKHGVNSKGKKNELQERILAHLQTTNEEEVEEEEEKEEEEEEEVEEEEEDDEEEEVETITLADGTQVYKDENGTLYSIDDATELGVHDVQTNSIIVTDDSDDGE